MNDALAHEIAGAIGDLLFGASVTITPTDDDDVLITVALEPRLAALVEQGSGPLGELYDALPDAGRAAVAALRPSVGHRDALPPSVRRAVRDIVAAEVLAGYARARLGHDLGATLVAEVIDYLIELSGTRVEAHDVTHGVVIADVLHDAPRLALAYPDDLRTAKRAPLLFDGESSVLVVDASGRARTELQRHRLDRLDGDVRRNPMTDGGHERESLVAQATRVFGGIGFLVRADRSIWTYVDGEPLLVRRRERWTAFPVELAASISNMIGGGSAADLVARTAAAISARPQGAILAIVDEATTLDGVVSAKDRFDLRNEIDPDAMRPETRLHHLIDVTALDEQTLSRLAALDGATVLDRDANLIAYGAIVTIDDSEHEGARTAAARTLSHRALVVLKVSVDGDITVFRDGSAVTTLLGHA